MMLLASALPAPAIELSHYLPGLPNLNDYFTPPPEAGELIYAQYNFYYHTDTIRDASGREIKSVTVEGPLGVPRTIDLDIDVDQIFLVPTFLWAPKWEVLGGRYGAYVAVPVGNPSIAAHLQTNLGGRSLDTSVWDIGDIYVQPLWFHWTLARDGRRPQIDTSIAYGFWAPTGRYHAGAADNVGFGFWEQQAQAAVRFMVDEDSSTAFTTAHTFNVGHDKEGKDVTPGAQYTLNWGFNRDFFEHWLGIGVIGYNTFQMTDDSGSDASKTKDQLHAAGLQIGVPKLGLSFKYYREFGAQDRFEGDLYTLTFAIPLEPIGHWLGL